MDYQAKREVVQAIQVEVACTLDAARGTGDRITLNAKKGDWFIFSNGLPIDALKNDEFKAKYEPVQHVAKHPVLPFGTPIGVPDTPTWTTGNTQPIPNVDHLPAFTSGYMKVLSP